MLLVMALVTTAMTGPLINLVMGRTKAPAATLDETPARAKP
jgi:hypothetical protein